MFENQIEKKNVKCQNPNTKSSSKSKYKKRNIVYKKLLAFIHFEFYLTLEIWI